MADILEIKNLNKKFGGVIATKDLNLSILEGELHAIKIGRASCRERV